VTHTPGPWSLTSQGEGDYSSHLGEHGSFCITADRGQIVIAQRGGVSARAAEFVANAHLIAAAPELLSALRELNRAWNATSFPCSDRMDAALKDADDAIAKAEGR
jgi:hypothetical protein